MFEMFHKQRDKISLYKDKFKEIFGTDIKRFFEFNMIEFDKYLSEVNTDYVSEDYVSEDYTYKNKTVSLSKFLELRYGKEGRELITNLIN